MILYTNGTNICVGENFINPPYWVRSRGPYPFSFGVLFTNTDFRIINDKI